jgi:alpha-1,6-mannosyltransferase
LSATVQAPVSAARRKPWYEARPWQTNAALVLIGWGLIGFTKQLLVENDHYVIGFSGVSSASAVLWLAALLILWLKPENVNRYTFGIILAVAILCRLVGLFDDPFLSSDVYRYAWDGVVQHAHMNPYRYIANDPALQALRDPNLELYNNMNRRDYAHTIYPPVAQMGFYLITFISATMTWMKMAMVLFEGLMLYGLLKLLRALGLRRAGDLGVWELGTPGCDGDGVYRVCALVPVSR